MACYSSVVHRYCKKNRKMGRRGPPKKPTKARLLDGTHREDRYGDPELEVQPPETTETPPAHLKGIAKEMWIALAADLLKMGLLTSVDRWQLEILCHAYATCRRTEKSDPAWFKAATVVDRIARQFGLTPSARQGMQAQSTELDATELKYFG